MQTAECGYEQDLWQFSELPIKIGTRTQPILKSRYHDLSLVLRSLNAVTKESAVMAVILGRPTPDPGFGPPVELLGGDAGGLLDLLGIGEALPDKSIAAEEAPPPLLQIEPARSCRNEDMMQARMLFQPGTRLQTVVTAEIVADNEDVASGVVSFNVGQESNVAFRVARSRTTRQLLAIAHAQGSVDPRLLGPAAIIHLRFNAMPVGRPARSRGKRARHYGAEFVGADGRRALGWLGVVGDDRRPFGMKSLSRAVPQLWVWRQRTPSRKRMVRI
jgi:hypothetical protein